MQPGPRNIPDFYCHTRRCDLPSLCNSGSYVIIESSLVVEPDKGQSSLFQPIGRPYKPDKCQSSLFQPIGRPYKPDKGQSYLFQPIGRLYKPAKASHLYSNQSGGFSNQQRPVIFIPTNRAALQTRQRPVIFIPTNQAALQNRQRKGVTFNKLSRLVEMKSEEVYLLHSKFGRMWHMPRCTLCNVTRKIAVDCDSVLFGCKLK